MITVCLIPIAVLLGLELVGQLLEDDGEQLLLASLVVSVAVPDSNLDRVPADRVADAANVVVEGWNRRSAFGAFFGRGEKDFCGVEMAGG